MNNLITRSLLTLALAFTFVTASASVTKDDVNVLFIQSADQGEFLPIANKPDYYQLKLTGVKNYIQYFTDRPERTTGIYPTSKFLQRWTNGTSPQSFKSIPPNAAVSGIERTLLIKKHHVNLVMELSNPRYDEKSESVTYDVHALNLAAKVPSKKLSYIALFIDDYCASCAAGPF